MSDSDPLAYARTKEPEVKEPQIRRRRISPIWILPIVAVLVAAYLAYTAFAEKGPVITITFKSASGLQAGKSPIKDRDIELGVVTSIEPSPDLSHVILTAQMNKIAAPHLSDSSHFWVVRPRLGLTSFSGLETLISGNYVEMDPGASGPARRDFNGLDEPPIVRSDEPGTSFVVTTGKIGSLRSGSPVFLRGIVVGEVIAYTFTGTEQQIPVRIFVKKPYDALIREGTQFWNASGISFSTGPDGFRVQLESLEAVLAGGIAFDTADNARDSTPAKADAVFALYDDRDAAVAAGFTTRARFLVEFTGSVRGLEVGAPVVVQGIPIGRVISFHLVVDAAAHTVRVPIVIEIDPTLATVLNMPSSEQIGKGDFMRAMVGLGLRAQLRTASLITGSLIVTLDFFPDAPRAEVVERDNYLMIPTVPSEMENLTHSVSQTLDKIAALPLDQIASDVRGTLDAARKLLSDTDTHEGPLLTSLQRTSQSADMVLNSVVSGYGSNSQVHAEISSLLRELQDTSRAVKVLANYLEQHPSSLIRGKAPPQ
jgi:paraquat-inducible protein B